MKLDIEKLHHAYLFEGERETLLPELFEVMDKMLKIERKGNPNFYVGEFDTFTIDDGRMLKEMQMNKVKEGDKQIFIVAFNFITREAQNSLLKIFEEPTKDTHFFLVTPLAHTLLPTLLSRLMFKPDLGVELLSLKEGERFLKASKGDRIQYIKELMEDIKDEKMGKQDAIRLLQELEVILSSKLNVDRASADERFALEAILKGEDYASDRSASLKMILEQLALVI